MTPESHLAKLTEGKVRELRALASVGVPYPLLSKEYGVSTVTVGQIRSADYMGVGAGE